MKDFDPWVIVFYFAGAVFGLAILKRYFRHYWQ